VKWEDGFNMCAELRRLMLMERMEVFGEGDGKEMLKRLRIRSLIREASSFTPAIMLRCRYVGGVDGEGGDLRRESNMHQRTFSPPPQSAQNGWMKEIV
jgi:hypothetical protein